MQRSKIPEPRELQMLKQKLANVTCKCLNCKKYNRRLKNKKDDDGVQLNQSSSLFGRFSQIALVRNKDGPQKIDKANGNSFIRTLCNDFICPSCRYIVDFLRGSINKVYKDEESEIKPISYEKSTEIAVDSIARTTSMTKKCNSSCNMKKHFSAEFTESNNDRMRNADKVTFVDSEKVEFANPEEPAFVDTEKITLVDAAVKEKVQSKQLMLGNCVCLEKFIASIRPHTMYDK